MIICRDKIRETYLHPLLRDETNCTTHNLVRRPQPASK
jgi:hypothetical protein